MPPGWFPPTSQAFGFPTQTPIGPFGQEQQARLSPFVPSPATAAPKSAAELPIGEKAQSKPASAVASPAVPAAKQGGPPPPVETKPHAPEVVQPPTTTTTTTTTAPAPAPPGAAPGAGAPQSATPSTRPTAAATTVTAAVPPAPTKAPPTGPKSDRIPPAIPIVNPTKPVASIGTAVANGPPGTAQSEATRAATAAVAAAMAKLPPQPESQQQLGPRPDVDGATRKLGELRPFDNNRPQRGGGYQNYRGRGGGGYYRNQHYGGGPGKKLEVPTTDYDFESANAKFNKQDLVKEAIASGSPLAEGDENGPSETVDTVDHNTNGNGSSQGSNVAGYNKSSSFFDNISSEARDREEGGPASREWRGEEEKRNIETFGQGSVDGYRSSFRGRGRGRGFGRGRGGGYGGRGGYGYGRGYGGRGRGGIRGGRGGASQSTGVPTVSGWTGVPTWG